MTTTTTPYCVSVWIDKENEGETPPIQYIRHCKGNVSTVHTRLTNNAMRAHPNWQRITVEAQEHNEP